MEKIKSTYGKAIVRGNRFDNFHKVGNTVLEIDPDFQKEVYANHELEVVACDPEYGINKGETAIVHWWVTEHNQVDGEKDTYFVERDNIFGFVRDGVVYGMDGTSFVEPVKKMMTSSVGLELDFTEKKHPNLSKVIYAPIGGELAVGDTVVHNQYGTWGIRYKQKDICILKYRNVYGKLVDGKFQPSPHALIVEPLDEDIDLKIVNGIFVSRHETVVVPLANGKQGVRTIGRNNSLARVVYTGSNIFEVKKGDIIICAKRKANEVDFGEGKMYHLELMDLFLRINQD